MIPIALKVQSLPQMLDEWSPVPLATANLVLEAHHYLGPIRSARFVFGQTIDGDLVQVQVWKSPTARLLTDADSTLELARWCITEFAPTNAGSWFMSKTVRWLRQHAPEVAQLVSYSELGHHSGGLYKACNWQPWPTHHADRYAADGVGYPSGHGSWDGVKQQTPKMRWRFIL